VRGTRSRKISASNEPIEVSKVAIGFPFGAAVAAGAGVGAAAAPGDAASPPPPPGISIVTDFMRIGSGGVRMRTTVTPRCCGGRHSS